MSEPKLTKKLLRQRHAYVVGRLDAQNVRLLRLEDDLWNRKRETENPMTPITSPDPVEASSAATTVGVDAQAERGDVEQNPETIRRFWTVTTERRVLGPFEHWIAQTNWGEPTLHISKATVRREMGELWRDVITSISEDGEQRVLP